MIEVIEIQSRERLLGQLALARKAGKTVFGFEKVKQIVTKKEFGVLIQAIDGSLRERKRISCLVSEKDLIICLNSIELGKIFGREKLIHCAVLKSGFLEKIIFNANLLNNLKKPLPHYN